MKKFIFLPLILLCCLGIFIVCCNRTEDPVQCSNGYSADSNNNCACPPGSIATYGRCLENDNTVLWGVSEGCPCEQDSLLMVILGRTNTPNAQGEYRLNFEYADTTAIMVGTGLYFIPTELGYDSLIETTSIAPHRYCVIDGWQYQKQATGRIYGNDSLVLHFFYTRPDPGGDDKYIIAPQTCGMVVRN
jgi:hypothetical protein